MKSNLSQHQKAMSHALQAAKRGRFTCSPAPMFGAYLQTPSGEHHVHRMEAAQGCLLQDALGSIDGPIAAVYCSSEPSLAAVELLHRKGCKALFVATLLQPQDTSWENTARQHGITLEVGLLAKDAQALNHDYLFCKHWQRPFIRLKLAASLDGRTALNNGKSKWITGPKARQDVQTFRAQSCCVLSGSGTVIADNPSLNVRWQDCPELQLAIAESQVRQPKRVIIDNKHRLDNSYQVFHLPGETYLVSEKGDANGPGAVLEVNKCGQYVDLSDMMQRLSEQLGIYSVWVEAGQALAGALFQAQLVDELILYQAPKLMGQDSRSLLTLPQYSDMSQVPELIIRDVCQIGTDIRIISRLK
ncbi:bifunctional diaminohydroxyphosphoribosylaminopyrimidine deaminase/5-amino-6-(5-phosphoribosylamino)uracil reductase RibD [Motilimonas pumila]|uniref:Bifunctional diaminohydroxyphosphoribosylaminopyrimidine deaminase/5-amino-6-(5-phosphoribosylamino)uracil reductase RibD n=1 Tax=Motilimonas pumila TaxID=2303987 RepID=A0A418YKP6_9GAMM|nr:bifunctional diaminohydroxyphosphoribosylaminopyrimidine deaminase/5-amino-6-(5-phosphoribosylamino)uracil reductase RibD [Motilimonas pumila]RJG51554.1 bifunctional diaminohydroxyphosphoribosylaminopyrimidine deaminase/5-amino-6-(5-phosphoribosylamino)uracil reductase RibD [Motilimonas pumila]